MRAIVICQPYASAIFMDSNPKNVENRTWSTNYRGPLAILAGKSRKWFSEAANQPAMFEPLQPWDNLPLGQIIGVVDLVDVQPMSPDLELNPWAFGPYCWVLRNPRSIIPVSFRGKQGLFKLSDDVEYGITHQGTIAGVLQNHYANAVDRDTFRKCCAPLHLTESGFIA